MRDLYKLFDKLMEKKIYFDLQFQHHVGGNWFNLTLDDKDDKRIYLNGETIETVEKGAMIIWGHLLNAKPSMPMPGR